MIGTLTRDELLDMATAVLPAKCKDDLYWRMFFGDSPGPYDRSDVEAFADFVGRYDMTIRRIIWSQAGAGRWQFDICPAFGNLRIRESGVRLRGGLGV